MRILVLVFLLLGLLNTATAQLETYESSCACLNCCPLPVRTVTVTICSPSTETCFFTEFSISQVLGTLRQTAFSTSVRTITTTQRITETSSNIILRTSTSTSTVISILTRTFTVQEVTTQNAASLSISTSTQVVSGTRTSFRFSTTTTTFTQVAFSFTTTSTTAYLSTTFVTQDGGTIISTTTEFRGLLLTSFIPVLVRSLGSDTVTFYDPNVGTTTRTSFTDFYLSLITATFNLRTITVAPTAVSASTDTTVTVTPFVTSTYSYFRANPPTA